jgi:hypothetical protein
MLEENTFCYMPDQHVLLAVLLFLQGELYLNGH